MLDINQSGRKRRYELTLGWQHNQPTLLPLAAVLCWLLELLGAATDGNLEEGLGSL